MVDLRIYKTVRQFIGESGVIFGGFGTFVAELVGFIAIATWAAVFSWIVFSIAKRNAWL